MLKAMNRGYTTAYYKELVAKIRSQFPEASFTTDLIVGFLEKQTKISLKCSNS